MNTDSLRGPAGIAAVSALREAPLSVRLSGWECEQIVGVVFAALQADGYAITREALCARPGGCRG